MCCAVDPIIFLKQLMNIIHKLETFEVVRERESDFKYIGS